MAKSASLCLGTWSRYIVSTYQHGPHPDYRSRTHPKNSSHTALIRFQLVGSPQRDRRHRELPNWVVSECVCVGAKQVREQRAR
jgi:hypothetical protein